MKNRGQMKKGQVSIFVIVAIVIAAAIVVLFVFREGIFGGRVSPEFRPVFSLYEECIKEETENALSLLGTQGGRIDVGSFIPGSDYAPFSSHLGFAGSAIPYWFYLSGNGIVKEDIPTKSEMEKEIGNFISERLNNCDFSSFYSQGFYVDLGSPSVDVEIQEDKVKADVSSDVVVLREDRSARKINHRIEVGSKLGKFYSMAKGIYEKQRNEAFLEEYAVDVLRTYAPVDGVEIQCSPKIWKTNDVVEEIYQGLEGNIRAIKFKGDYYNLNKKENDYFVVEHEVDEQVNLIYQQDWPSKIEIFGENVGQELMIAEPVGNKEGLGVLGFCYAPYHYVYDLSFPVLIQINDGLQIFQFPVVVIIEGNLPREAEFLPIELEREETFNICEFSEGNAVIKTLDLNLNPVAANISYQCFDTTCRLGETNSEGVLETAIPVCVNGFLVAEAEGYANEKQRFSSNSESFADLILEREYELDIEFKVGGKTAQGDAVIHFENEEGSVSAVLPETKKIKLKEGLYNISMHAYGNSNVVIPKSNKVECIDVAKKGVLGFFGATEEQCIEVEIPEVKVENALIGGGKTNMYILESDLAKGKIIIDGSELPNANSLEQLQYNFEVFDSLGIEVRFE